RRRVEELEKKMIRAEKRRHDDLRRQLERMKERYFPGNGLQERSESMLAYYARWGNAFLDRIYEHSLSFEQEFTVLTCR
ncbi:MAG TPA: bacillithiol biosynthesis BshC, partial [Lacibacter sp.]|nr:bacillithiol biosynthesis BshC [Lacibacter sp.]